MKELVFESDMNHEFILNVSFECMKNHFEMDYYMDEDGFINEDSIVLKGLNIEEYLKESLKLVKGKAKGSKKQVVNHISSFLSQIDLSEVVRPELDNDYYGSTLIKNKGEKFDSFIAQLEQFLIENYLAVRQK